MWNFWKKKKKTDINLNAMEFDINKADVELEKDFSTLEFQWIKGENVGAVEKFISIVSEGDLKFVTFESKNRVNLGLLTEYMESFPLGSNPANIDKLNRELPVPPGQKTEVNSINYSPANNKLSAPLNTSSPIYGLLSKQKPNLVDVNISIKINLPPKELYGVLTDSFDNAESDIVDYVISSLNIDDIKKALSESILNTYYESKGINRIDKEEKTES